MTRGERVATDGADRLPAAVLGGALVATLVAAPWFFGGVAPAGRAFLEIVALVVLPAWLALAWRRPAAIPGSAATLALCGLVAIGVVQLAPLPASWIEAVSPGAAALWRDAPPPEAQAAEARLLGVPPGTLDAPARLSFDPPATASALRTGAALALLLVSAWTHAALRGPRLVVAALLVSGAFQALYGLLVLVSGADRIWHVPKEYFLDSATGTFVNANHFAVWLGMAGCCGAALLAGRARGGGDEDRARHWLVRLLGARGARGLFAAFALAAIGAGIVASFSRAGIVLAGLGIGATLLLGAPRRRVWRGAIALALLAAAAAVPLAQLGADRLLAQYAQLPDDAIEEGGRLRVWGDTVDLFLRAPALGSGFGTFATAYPLVRSAEVRKYYAHAHNDPLQLAAEAGVPGVLCGLLLLAALAPATLSALAGERGPEAVGVACALAVAGLHALIDFDLHIPATAAAAAALAGTLGGLTCRRS